MTNEQKLGRRVIWFGRADHPNGSNNATYTSAIKQQRSLQYENRWDLLDLNSVKPLVEEAVGVLDAKEN